MCLQLELGEVVTTTLRLILERIHTIVDEPGQSDVVVTNTIATARSVLEAGTASVVFVLQPDRMKDIEALNLLVEYPGRVTARPLVEQGDEENIIVHLLKLKGDNE